MRGSGHKGQAQRSRIRAVLVNRIDHGDEVLVRNVVHDAVARAADVPAARLENVHMLLHVTLNVVWRALDKGRFDIDVP